MENIKDHFITIEKAHVKEYQRKTKSGNLVNVKEHEDKRNNLQEEKDKLLKELKKVSNEIDKIVEDGGRVTLADPLSRKHHLLITKLKKLKKQMNKAVSNDLVVEDFIDIEKAHIKSHTKKTKSGKMINVKEHEDKRKNKIEEIISKGPKGVGAKIDFVKYKDGYLVRLYYVDRKDRPIYDGHLKNIEVKNKKEIKQAKEELKKYFVKEQEDRRNKKDEINILDKKIGEFGKNYTISFEWETQNKSMPKEMKEKIKPEWSFKKLGLFLDKETQKEKYFNKFEGSNIILKVGKKSFYLESDNWQEMDSELEKTNKAVSNDLEKDYVDISKANIKAHTRKTKSGKIINVKQHFDKRIAHHKEKTEKHKQLLKKYKILSKKYYDLGDKKGNDKLHKRAKIFSNIADLHEKIIGIHESANVDLKMLRKESNKEDFNVAHRKIMNVHKSNIKKNLDKIKKQKFNIKVNKLENKYKSLKNKIKTFEGDKKKKYEIKLEDLDNKIKNIKYNNLIDGEESKRINKKIKFEKVKNKIESKNKKIISQAKKDGIKIKRNESGDYIAHGIGSDNFRHETHSYEFPEDAINEFRNKYMKESHLQVGYGTQEHLAEHVIYLNKKGINAKIMNDGHNYSYKKNRSLVIPESQREEAKDAINAWEKKNPKKPTPYTQVFSNFNHKDFDLIKESKKSYNDSKKNYDKKMNEQSLKLKSDKKITFDKPKKIRFIDLNDKDDEIVAKLEDSNPDRIINTGLDGSDGAEKLHIYYSNGNTYIVPSGEYENADSFKVRGIVKPSLIKSKYLKEMKAGNDVGSGESWD